MAKTARFFLSRIVKRGTLDANRTEIAIRQAVAIASRDFAWTIVDVAESHVRYRSKEYRYLSGKLVKYDPDAIIEVIDELSRKVRVRPEPNMQKASSLFVYFPDEAVFAHRHIWNEIRDRDFRVQISRVIEAHYDHFFVECELLPITDLRQFLPRLAELEYVAELKARVSPPNPLFGRYWADLKKYIEQRRLKTLSIQERAKSGESIDTATPEIAREIESTEAPPATPEPASIGDAAVMMAADGYGRAEVVGNRGGQQVVIKTSDSAMQIRLAADVTADNLAAAVVRELARMAKSRVWEH